MYKDDIKLFAKNEKKNNKKTKQLETLIHAARIYSQNYRNGIWNQSYQSESR